MFISFAPLEAHGYLVEYAGHGLLISPIYSNDGDPAIPDAIHAIQEKLGLLEDKSDRLGDAIHEAIVRSLLGL
jgi:hypothetical protein